MDVGEFVNEEGFESDGSLDNSVVGGAVDSSSDDDDELSSSDEDQHRSFVQRLSKSFVWCGICRGRQQYSSADLLGNAPGKSGVHAAGAPKLCSNWCQVSWSQVSSIGRENYVWSRCHEHEVQHSPRQPLKGSLSEHRKRELESNDQWGASCSSESQPLLCRLHLVVQPRKAMQRHVVRMGETSISTQPDTHQGAKALGSPPHSECGILHLVRTACKPE